MYRGIFMEHNTHPAATVPVRTHSEASRPAAAGADKGRSEDTLRPAYAFAGVGKNHGDARRSGAGEACQMHGDVLRPAPVAAVVSDLSCFGRAALAVSIGALSAMGVQPVALPTSVLSSHTGGFGTPAKADLTGFMRLCAQHWADIGLRFDAVCTGYMANADQAEAAAEFLRMHPESVRIVDPVMGDHGRMYSSLPADMPERMRVLSAGAIITPNRTEAALLTGLSMQERPTALLEALLEKTRAACALITGADNANIWMDRAEGKAYVHPYEPEEGAYPGTGDLFAAVLTGALAKGEPMQRAVERAAWFVKKAVARTNALGSDSRCGVQFEGLLHLLADGAAECYNTIG